MNLSPLQSTIREALENAPPEHQELALAALIEARFNVWPKEVSGHYAPPASLVPPMTGGISEL